MKSLEKEITSVYFRLNQVEYRIKWKNYPEEENTWEPLDNLSCKEIMEDYEENFAEHDGLLEWVPMPIEILKKDKIGGKVSPTNCCLLLS